MSVEPELPAGVELAEDVRVAARHVAPEVEQRLLVKQLRPQWSAVFF